VDSLRGGETKMNQDQTFPIGQRVFCRVSIYRGNLLILFSITPPFVTFVRPYSGVHNDVHVYCSGLIYWACHSED
jgi:hypothetical protein